MTIAARLAALEHRRPRTDGPMTWTDRELAEVIEPSLAHLTDDQLATLTDASEALARRQPLMPEQLAMFTAWEMAAHRLALAFERELRE